MSQGRIFPLLGPAAVLYLIAEVIASSSRLDVTAVLMLALALALSALPVRALRREDALPGARRVALLGVLAGAALVRWANPGLPSLYLDLAFAFALSLLAAGTVHLASNTPDRPEALARNRRAIAFVTGALALASWAAAGLAVLPVFDLFGTTILVSPRLALALPAFAMLALAAALALRLARRRLKSSPEALASGAWAQLGLGAALLAAVAVAALLATGVVSRGSISARLIIALGAAALVSGHVAMLGGRRQTYAGRSTRRVLASVTSVLAVGAIGSQLAPRIPVDPVGAGASLAFAVALAALLYRAARLLFDRLLAPHRGMLLRAVDEALDAAVGATSLEELGAAILPPLRRASGTIEGEPLLFTLHPARRVRVDAAGVAHVEERDPSPAILEHLTPKSGEIVVSAPLLEQVVRRADLRPLVDALEREDALALVPLSREQELEGFLIVPRGTRRAALTLEEIDRLERLGKSVSAQVALLSAEERARGRVGEALRERDALDHELEKVQEELAKLRADAEILRSAGPPARAATKAIAYSPAMRAVIKRVHEVAPLDAPALLVGRDESALERVGQLLHETSGRNEGPIVVADCAAVRPERAEAALFGDSAAMQPGWLRVAEGGTCLLLDVPALSLDAQAKLAEALATRQAHPADGAAAYPIDARVVATSRFALEALLETGRFDVELHRRLEPLTLHVPSLASRREDLPSLILLALDRSCRIAGREVMGIDPDALEVLVAYEWPGNLRELGSVIERAVSRASGPNVRLADLPALTLPEEPDVEEDEDAKTDEGDPLRGTFAEIEARALSHALVLAENNKSEAARMLGLKRTTFLDKLKRHGMLGEAKKGAEGTAA